MVVAFVAASTGSVAASSLSVSSVLPASAVAGHVLICHVAQERGDAGMTLSGSSWTQLFYGANAGGQQTQMVATKTVAAADLGSTITATVSAGRRMAMSLLLYSGVQDVQFVLGTPASTGASSNGSTSPSATPTADNSMLVGLVASTMLVSPWTLKFTESAGWTERTDVTATMSTAGNPQSASADKLLTGGAGVVQTGVSWSSVASADGTTPVNNQFHWPSTLVLTPGAPNVAPTAAFSVSLNYLTASFNAAASTDPDGTITSYRWDFGDGTTGTGVTASHTYAAPGSYTATLVVTDNKNTTGTTTQTVKTTGGLWLATSSGWVPARTFTATPSGWN